MINDLIHKKNDLFQKENEGINNKSSLISFTIKRAIMTTLKSTIFLLCAFFSLKASSQCRASENLAGQDILNIIGPELCENVKTLTLRGESLNDLSAIAHVKTVEELKIRGTSLVNLGPFNVVLRDNPNGGSDHLIRDNPNLQSLNTLIIEGGSIEIDKNESLTSLDFSMTGSSYGEIEINNNNKLTDLSILGDKQYTGLEITNNAALTDLQGLSNLTICEPNGNFSINSLIIKNNNALASLSDLQVSAGIIEISDNDQLYSLEGVTKSNVNRSLTISNNATLHDLSGISAFNPIETTLDITISNNPELISLQGLSNMDHFTKIDLLISNNHSLTDLRGFEDMRVRNVLFSNNAKLRSTAGMKNIETFLYFEIKQSQINDVINLTEADGRVRIFDNPEMTELRNLGNSSDSVDHKSRIEIYDNDKLELIENSTPKSKISEYFIHDNNALKTISLDNFNASYRIRENRALTSLKINKANAVQVQENNELETMSLGTATSLTVSGDAFLELVLNGSMFEIKNPLYKISGDGSLKRLTFSASVVFLPEISLKKIEHMTIDGTVLLRSPISKVENLDFNSDELTILQLIEFDNVNIKSDDLYDLYGLEDISANKMTIQSPSIAESYGMKNIDVKELSFEFNPLLESIDFTDKNITTEKLNIKDNHALKSIRGLNQLVTGDEEVEYKIWDNDLLSEIEFGPAEIEAIGQINIRNNPNYASCCNVSEWVGDRHFIDKNGGICNISGIFPQQLSDYCDIPVRIYDKRTRKLLNTVQEIDPDQPELVIYEGTEEELVFEVPKVGEDVVTMEGANGYQFKQEAFSETSTAFEFDEPLFQILEAPDNFKIILSSENEGEIKSFDVKPIKRPVIFIDMNEDQGRNFTQIMRDARRIDKINAGRMRRVVFKEELTEGDRRHNLQALKDGIEVIRRRTLGTKNLAVDIVAFGKTGLYSRQYIANLPAEVSRFITVNTPHSGSELEDASLVYADIASTFFQKLIRGASPGLLLGGPYRIAIKIGITVAIALSKKAMFTIANEQLDAYQLNQNSSFASNSRTVLRINERHRLSGILKHSITSYYDHDTTDMLLDNSVPNDIREKYPVFDNLLCLEFPRVKPRELAGDVNNTYASIEAQSGGLAKRYQSEIEGDYGNLDSEDMRLLIFDLLDNQANQDRFTTDPYTPRDVPENPIEACKKLIEFKEIVNFISEQIDGSGMERTLGTAEVKIDTLINDQLSLSYEGDLLSLYVFTTELEFYQADLSNGPDVVLEVLSNEGSITPKLYMAYGITSDSAVVDSYYLHVESEIDLETYLLQDFEVTGQVGDTLSFQMFARDTLENEVDVTLLVTNDLWPEELINALTPGNLIAKEATNDTLQFIIAEQEVNVFTDIQDETGYFGLEASDSTLVPENTGLINSVDTVAIITNENIDQLTFYVSGDTTIFTATLDKDQFLISLIDTLDFEADTLHQFTLVASNNDITDSLTMDISITNVNEAPSITMNDLLSIHENDSNLFVGTVLGTDPEQDSLTYRTSLPEKLSFQNDSIWVISGFDHEADSIINVDIIASDGEFETTIPAILPVTNVNESPSLTIAELVSINENDSTQYIAELSALDPEKDSIIYFISLPSLFEVRNDSLWATASFNHEIDSLILLELAVSDGVFSDSLTAIITIADVNESPTDIFLNNDSVYVAEMASAWAGTLSSIDEDFNERFTYILESFTNLFEIRSDSLFVGTEAPSGLYTLPITTTDMGGLSTTVNITLKVEREVILGLSRISFVVYPNPASDQLSIRHSAGLIPDYWIYDLRGSLLLKGKGTQIDVSKITSQLVILRTCFQGNCNDIKVALRQ